MTSLAREKYWSLAAALFLISAVFLVYGQILGHDFIFNWDDNLYVIENPVIRGFSPEHLRTVFSTFYVGNYAPVQMVSYMLDYTLWGLQAGGFLLTNLLLHMINGLLLFRLLLKLHGERLVALTGAALFLLHPVQVESVAWVSQRKNLLALFFLLAAWELYRIYRGSDGRRRTALYCTSLLLFLLALLSKSVAVIFPPLLVVFDFCYPAGQNQRRWLDKIPFLLVAAAVAFVAMFSQQPEYGGGRSGFHGGSPLATFLTMLPVFCRYLGMLLWPAGLSAEYAPVIHTSADPVVIGAALVLGVILWASWQLFRVDRRLFFWLLLFFLGLLPVSQIVPLVTLMNDRYLYLPLVGISVLAGAGAQQLQRKLAGYRRGIVYPVLLVPLVALGVVSHQRAGDWRDAFSLWNAAARTTPLKATVWANLGETRLAGGDLEGALLAYETGLQMNPAEQVVLINLGILHTRYGDLDKGQMALQKLVELDPKNVKGWAHLGNNQLNRGNPAEAEKCYKKALSIDPASYNVHMMLGNLAMLREEPDQARKYYEQAEMLRRNDAEVAFQLACVESRAGRREQGIAWLEKALTRGYRDFGKLQDSSELSLLRQDERFIKLLNRYAEGVQ